MKKDKYIIYGAAAIGNMAKEAIEKCGLEVIGYIDKRAHEIEQYNNLPVWSVEDSMLEKYCKDVVVFVGVKNVFEHEKIARILTKKGFEYIVYKANSVLMGVGTTEEQKLARLWDVLFDGEGKCKDIEIPMCQVFNNGDLYDYGLIQEDGEDVVAYIPTEFIYTNNYTQNGMMKWGNVNILSFFTHINFFRFLDGREDATPEEYLKEYCIYTAELQKKIVITDAWKENVINNRRQIFEKMSEAMNLDKNFFLRNAPQAVWNQEKKYFNLTSGKHRSTFLAAKGMRYIPLRISKNDYNMFYNYDEVMQTKKSIDESKNEITITHPCFYRDDRSLDNGEYNFLSWFARYYGKELFYKYGKVDFSNLYLIDYSKDQGTLSRYVLRAGGIVCRRVKPENLEQQLNKLFYSKLRYKKDDINVEKKINILVVEEDNIDEISLHKAHCKEVIIKYCKEEQIDSICKNYNLCIIKKINSKYENLERKSSYLLNFL